MKTHNNLRIYCLDDDLFFNSLVEQHFENHGIEISTFLDEATLIDACDQEPDLILLDFNLGDYNSLSLLMDLVNRFPNTKVVMLSAQESLQTAVDTLKFGAYDYVVKDHHVFTQLEFIVRHLDRMLDEKRKMGKSVKNNYHSLLDWYKNKFNMPSLLKKLHYSQLNTWLVLSMLFFLNSCSTQNLIVGDLENKGSLTTKTTIPEKYYTTKTTPAVQPASMDQSANKNLHLIAPDDKISIGVWNHNDLSIGSVFDIYNSNEVYGKWIMVDYGGYVKLPQLGKIKLAGLNIDEASQKLTELYAQHVVDPIVSLKVLNRQITVLGEVKTPGNYTLDKEQNTLLEVIGRAGGFNFYADKRKLKVVRQLDEGTEEFNIDLTKMDNLVQNNMLLKAGDVIYTPSRNHKQMDKRAATIVPITSALTTGALIISLFLRK